MNQVSSQVRSNRFNQVFNRLFLWLKGREGRLLDQLLAAYNDFKQWYSESQVVVGQAYKLSEQKQQQNRANNQHILDQQNAEADGVHRQEMQLVQNNLNHFYNQLVATWHQDWNGPVWKNYFPPAPGGRLPCLTRIGEFELNETAASTTVPCLVPIIGATNGNLIINSGGQAKNQALAALQTAMFRLITTVPPSKLRFVLIDPVGLGRNMAGFMELPEELYGSKVWTETRHIEEQLLNLTEHIETVFQKYLRNRYNSMEEYNQAAGEVAEPYRVLVVADFPANFSDAAAQRLISLAKNGPRAGLHCVITVDNDQKLPYNFNWQDLANSGNLITHSQLVTQNTPGPNIFNPQQFVWMHPSYQNIPIRLDKPPSPALFHQVIPIISEKAKENSKVEAPFPRQKLNQVSWWQGNANEALVAEIGRVGARNSQKLQLDSELSHSGLIVGRPGSGKSFLLHALIMSLVLDYSPQELELYLLDFKEVEFKVYAENLLPHAKVVAIKVEREFGLSVLEGLNNELSRRIELFRVNSCAKLNEARQKINSPLPRILLIADEFQELFTEDDALSRKAFQIIERIVRQGRAFGLHVLMASQTLSGANPLPGHVIRQMPIRIALQCADADSRLIFSDDNDAARLLSRPGQAIYNAANGLVEGNSPFQVYLLAKEKRPEILQQVAVLARAKSVGNKPIIFEGTQLAAMIKNSHLTSTLVSPHWSPTQKAVPLWLGDPVSIKDTTSLLMRRQSRSNVLVVGQPEETGLACLISSLVSLTAQQSPAKIQVFFHDFSNVDDYWHGLATSLTDLPHDVEFRNRREITRTIDELTTILETRLADSSTPITKSVYLFIHGVWRAKDLECTDPDGYMQSEAAQKLSVLYRKGPDVGIHILLWCDTYRNLLRVLNRNDVKEFGWRIVTQISEEDSNALLERPDASKLGNQRAYLYNYDNNHLEKFIPYALPEQAQLEAIGRRLRAKGF